MIRLQSLWGALSRTIMSLAQSEEDIINAAASIIQRKIQSNAEATAPLDEFLKGFAKDGDEDDIEEPSAKPPSRKPRKDLN